MRHWPLSTSRPRLWTLDWSPFIPELFNECLLYVQPCTHWHNMETDSLGLLLSGREQTPEFTVIHVLMTEQAAAAWLCYLQADGSLVTSPRLHFPI